MAIPLYLTTIEQDIFDTFRYLPHAVAVGVGFVTVAAAWKNQQIQKKRKRLEQYRALHGGQLLAWFLVAVYFAMLISITLLSREPGSRTGVDLKLFETWGNQCLPDRYFVENILLFLPFGVLLPAAVPFLRRWWYCVYAAFATSMMLETVQLLTERGFCQLDDVVDEYAWSSYRVSGVCTGAEMLEREDRRIEGKQEGSAQMDRAFSSLFYSKTRK